MIDPLTVLYYEVGKDPERVAIPHQLEEMQRLVGGYIESLALFEGVTLICNEEGKLQQLSPNRRLGPEVIVGNFFVVAIEDEDFVPLSEAQLSEVLSLLEWTRADA